MAHMKFVLISDTHGHHHELELPGGDLIIHAGDFCNMGAIEDVYDFLEWYAALDFDHKLLIAGNHDFFPSEQAGKFAALLPDTVTYLNDSAVEIDGIKFWGSPVQPDLIGWPFGRYRGFEMKNHWDLIPPDIDVLVTHTPPYGILDQTSSGRFVGCEELAKRLTSLSVRLHVFGHIHASYGKEVIGDTTFINASNFDTEKGLVNPPIVFDWE
jgi:Icc-related predicted phosphoesterase